MSAGPDTRSLPRGLAALAMAVLFLAGHALTGGAVGQAHAQRAHTQPERLRLDIGKISPRTVSEDTPTLTVTGTLTNVGDRRITRIDARIELGTRLGTTEQAHRALRGPLRHYPAASPFEPVTPSLEPGQSVPLRLTVPLDGAQGGLPLRRPGVYPLLINVNGTPDYGGRARLVASNLLMPVRGVPGQASSNTDEDVTGGPLGVTMLWPITSRSPPVVRDTYGEPLVLADDEIATALAPGGRLYGLVDSASAALERDNISAALCFAIDPALLNTVRGMTNGYRVRTDDGLVAGGGVRHAKQWLTALRGLVEDQCLLQLPYADADLGTLPRIDDAAAGDNGLMRLAVDGTSVIRNVLGVRPLPGVLWPGTDLSRRAYGSAASAGVSTVITSAARLSSGTTDTAATSGFRLTGAQIRAQSFDPLVHRGLTTRPETADIATQNGLATLVFRARQERAAQAGPLLVAPPHRWNAPPEELSGFLRALEDLAAAGTVEPVPLRQSLDTATTAELDIRSSVAEAATALSGELVNKLADVDTTATDLASAMSVDATSLVRPATLVRPLRHAVLRASSAAWQGAPTARTATMRAAREQVTAITSQVTVTPPPQPIALASGESPLPVYIENALPVTITARIDLLNSAGLRPGPSTVQTIPANSARNRYIPIEPLRAGRIAIDVRLSTQQGTQLGDTARFELVSTEYGIITIVVTSVAAGALLLLSGRRIYRRVRVRRARA